MKIKLLLFAGMLSGIAAHAALDPKVVVEISEVASPCTGVAIDKSGNAMPCYYVVNGNSATFRILDENLAVAKEFTLKDVFFKDSDNNKYKRPNIGSTLGSFTKWDGDNNVILTQNVFDDDDKWEVAIEIEENYKELPYVIKNEDGVTLGSFDPREHGAGSIGLRYLFLGNKGYVTYKNEWDAAIPEKQYMTGIIDFNSGGAGMTVAASLTAAGRVYPNPLPQGTPLTIEFDNEVEAGALVVITDMRGRVAYRLRLDDCSDRVVISAGRLGNGTYLYSVISNDELIQSGKVIVE